MSRVDRYIVRKVTGEGELAGILNAVTDYKPILISSAWNSTAVGGRQTLVYTVVFEKIHDPLDMG
jgi:hypothetical protein